MTKDGGQVIDMIYEEDKKKCVSKPNSVIEISFQVVDECIKIYSKLSLEIHAFNPSTWWGNGKQKL